MSQPLRANRQCGSLPEQTPPPRYILAGHRNGPCRPQSCIVLSNFFTCRREVRQLETYSVSAQGSCHFIAPISHYFYWNSVSIYFNLERSIRRDISDVANFEPGGFELPQCPFTDFCRNLTLGKNQGKLLLVREEVDCSECIRVRSAHRWRCFRVGRFCSKCSKCSKKC